MADRFFPNDFPDFVAETTEEGSQTAAGAADSLSNLVSLPYHKTTERFLRYALDFKDKVALGIYILVEISPSPSIFFLGNDFFLLLLFPW